MRKITELTKVEKIQLLQAVAAGTIDRENLNQETLVATKKSDPFISLMAGATTVVCLTPEAKEGMKAINELLKNITDEKEN